MSILSKLAKFASVVDHFITDGVFTRKLINARIKEYGEMIEFKIDNKGRKISAEVLLKGEASPIKINVDEYELIKDEGSSKIIIKDAGSGREWIDAALRNFVVGKSFKLPEKSIDYINEFLG